MRQLLLFLFFVFQIFLHSAEVAFITTKESSAKEFAKLTEILDKKKISWEIFAVGKGESYLKKEKISHSRMSVWMPKKEIESLSYDDVIAFAKVTAKACKKSKIIITEISDPFIARLHFELGLISSAKRWIYYPEDQIMGGNMEKSFNQILKTRPEGVVFASSKTKEVIEQHQIDAEVDVFTVVEEEKSSDFHESLLQYLFS